MTDCGSLDVTIVEAKNLPNMDAGLLHSSSDMTDAYVVVACPGMSKSTEQKTKVILDSLNPTWNETFKFVLCTSIENNVNANLVLRIKDQDYGATDDDVGGCTLNLQRVATSKVFDDWVVISKDAKIHVRITYTHPALFHGRSWMHDTRPHIEDKTLTQISIPGAHDTCTSRIHAETSELCPDAPDIVKKLATWPGIASVLKKITAGWSRAQSHTVAELARHRRPLSRRPHMFQGR